MDSLMNDLARKMQELYGIDSKQTSEQKADAVINGMVTLSIAGAVIPAQVNWALAAAVMGAGTVVIGNCYNVKLSGDEAWKLVLQFIRAAGVTFAGLVIGTKILSFILASTGIGYAGAVMLDAATFAPLAYAVGSCAKAYFREDLHKKAYDANMQRFGELMRQKFREGKQIRQSAARN